MTGNTKKVATWFKETFEYYNFDVTVFRMAKNADWEGMDGKLYFEDYDVICLGSPIVGGFPLQIVVKAMSTGAGGGEGGLDKSATENPQPLPGEAPTDAQAAPKAPPTGGPLKC